jgi:Tol biopolymer transport system component
MNDTNGVHDIFEYDREQNYTIRVSVDSNGMQANDLSYRPRISGDGRYVTFESNASNLALGVDNSRAQDVFVHDRLFGSTHLVSANIDGIGGNSSSRYAAISADGRYIVFNSYASNLVPGDTNNRSDMFVSDRLTNTITRIDVLPNGGQLAEGTTPDVYPSISADGRYVAFESGDDTMVPGDLNHEWDVFVRDRVAGTTTLASVATDGTQGDRGASSPAISGDGRHVAFAAYAHNWVDTGLPDYVISANIYVRDLEGQ